MCTLGQAVAVKLLLDNTSGWLQCLLIVSLGEFRRSPEIHLLPAVVLPLRALSVLMVSQQQTKGAGEIRGAQGYYSAWHYTCDLFSQAITWHSCYDTVQEGAWDGQECLGSSGCFSASGVFWVYQPEWAPLAAGWEWTLKLWLPAHSCPVLCLIPLPANL